MAPHVLLASVSEVGLVGLALRQGGMTALLAPYADPLPVSLASDPSLVQGAG